MKEPNVPKNPEDHKPKKPTVNESDGGKIVTLPYYGLTVTVLTDALDDFELLDRLATLEQNPAQIPGVLRQAVGDDQFAVVMDALRDKATGRVSMEAGVGFFRDLFGALNPNS